MFLKHRFVQVILPIKTIKLPSKNLPKIPSTYKPKCPQIILPKYHQISHVSEKSCAKSYTKTWILKKGAGHPPWPLYTHFKIQIFVYDFPHE